MPGSPRSRRQCRSTALALTRSPLDPSGVACEGSSRFLVEGRRRGRADSPSGQWRASAPRWTSRTRAEFRAASSRSRRVVLRSHPTHSRFLARSIMRRRGCGRRARPWNRLRVSKPSTLPPSSQACRRACGANWRSRPDAPRPPRSACSSEGDSVLWRAACALELLLLGGLERLPSRSAGSRAGTPSTAEMVARSSKRSDSHHADRRQTRKTRCRRG